MTRVRAVQGFVVGVALMGLCACGGSDAQTADPTTGGSATAAPAATTPASTPAADQGGSADKAEDLCQFLETEKSELKSTGAAALANFTGAYSGWIEKDPANRKLQDAQELDTLSTAGCPEARQDILAKLEVDSFAAAFGG